MKERPILFSAPMVRAILDGRKTQTRRIIKPQPPLGHEWAGWCVSSTDAKDEGKAVWAKGDSPFLVDAHRVRCPYGKPGDRLWVRETWGVISHAWDESGRRTPWTPDRPANAIREMPFGRGYYSGHVIYAADGPNDWAGDDDGGGEPRSAWHPSIHMPRSASRITVEITSVRVERLHDITRTDAIAEGLDHVSDGGSPWGVIGLAPSWSSDPRKSYRALWESINGAGSWDANPWVWVIEFKRVELKEESA